MLKSLGEGAWLAEGAKPGKSVCIAFGTHGNERAPIVAGERLVEELSSGQLELTAGRLLLVLSNPKASAQDERWSEGGVDLNRCFHPDVLAKEPELYEEGRAREIVGWLEETGAEVLVDFHCTVEPGERFMMHHPSVEDPAHREVIASLAAGVVLADPALQFGGVSFDEWMSTRGRVGICYETGWIKDPANTPEAVHAEMINVLASQGMIARDAQRFDDKRRLQLYGVVECAAEGFRWEDGVGQNLQALAAGTKLGAYGDGTPVTLERDATLIFPKKKPELVQLGKPLVLLAETLP